MFFSLTPVCSWLTVSHMLVCGHIFTVRLPSGGDISLFLTPSLTSVGVLSERRQEMNITRLLAQLLWRKTQDGASNGHISILQCAAEVGKLSRCVGHVPQLRRRSGKQRLVHMNVQVIKKHPSCSAVLSECMMLISDCQNLEPPLAKQPNKAPPASCRHHQTH